ncbi:MAG: radical SAM protein [Candidatus Heimdallarchaeota archaeon]|nr:radical SAM protein [Candidatus Heimdallarchaeota archaeon]MBY8993582.1 radical SAM protein [Candidatus Heimdallarchaeota archaeon]
MTRKESSNNNGFRLEINLSENIPFDLSILKDENALQIDKGVMQGEIDINSLKLELTQGFPIKINSIDFRLSKTKDVIIEFISNVNLDKNLIINVLQKTISQELPQTLRNKDTKKPLLYITNDLFGIPLIGSMYFGVIDRGTNLLQIRPITGCPLNCPFCSVDEGPISKTKLRDYLVDTDYLVNTYNAIVTEKNLKEAEAHLDGQGEPMAYPYLPELVQKLWENEKTKVVSIQTNGWYLTEKLIDELVEVNLSRINLSINALSSSLSKKLSGKGDYKIDKMLELAEYIANSKISLLLAPVWIPGVNDQDIEELVQFSLKVNPNETKYPTLGIQNYLTHDVGRNLKGIQQKKFADFNQQLREIEKKFGAKNLVLKPYMFNTYKTEMIQNPMRINEVVNAEVVLLGRQLGEVIVKAKNRLIHVSNANHLSLGKNAKVRITRNRHNIFFAECV